MVMMHSLALEVMEGYYAVKLEFWYLFSVNRLVLVDATI